ncbi:hypothetical protein ACPV4S_24140 [Vibrio alginolyticus]|uniref:hypothetical protein n=1 Tax=Vibrio alginolyticus TaxID=663 RepID=UPI0004F3B9AA
MIGWEIILAFGAVGSAIMWVKDIFTKHKSIKEAVYPAVCIILTIVSATLYVHNARLMDPTEQAKILVKSWPDSVYNGSFHPAEAKGITIAGLRYLETYRELHPDTYAIAKEDFANTDFTDNIQGLHTADTMITIIRSYAGEEVTLR